MRIIIKVSMIAILITALNGSYAQGEIAWPPDESSPRLEEISSSIQSPEGLVLWLRENFQYQMKIPDKPQTPQETLKLKRGDCDDFAKLASAILANKGIRSQVLILKFEGLKISHAICIWKDREGFYSFISNQELIHTQKETIEEAVKKYYPDCSKIVKSPKETPHKIATP